MLRLPIPLLDALGRGPRHAAGAGAHRFAAVCGGYVRGVVSSGRFRVLETSDADQSNRGEAHYGCASLPLLLADPARRFHVVLLDHFSPANARQENPFAARLLQLATFYPSLHVTNVVGDAAFGYDVVLRTVYRALRAHDTDKNQALWPIRGYDAKGHPVCPFGHAFTANGFDFDRQRHKWFCDRACL